jgi:predicted nucleic acid-binding protein
MYLFDTDILINSLKPRPSPKLSARIENLPNEVRFTSAITVGEIYYGALSVPTGPEILKTFEELVFPHLSILPFDAECSRIYGRIKAGLKQPGRMQSGSDLRIAAIALRHGLTLITGNIKHFQGIPRLKVENWLGE